MALTLLIGNKNYSSWSMRPWIAMKVAGIPFQEEVIPLDASDFKARVTKISGTGKVPALADGDDPCLGVAGDPGLSSRHLSAGASCGRRTPKARAHARAIAAEMHAGFVPLRRHCPMNMRRPAKGSSR